MPDLFGERISVMAGGPEFAMQRIARPDSGTTVYHYDANGNVTHRTDRIGRDYQPWVRRVQPAHHSYYPGDPAENVAFSYDQAGAGFGVGRLTGVTDAVGTMSRTYDERGNVLSETRGNGTATLGTTYTYDAAGRPASITELLILNSEVEP
jgi:YD repeat-containing protein